jgi:diguanylate cyclase (GGDEF)-like protein/PAS domain S-box-containing protein
MDGSVHPSGGISAPGDDADLLVAPAAVLEGLPDAVVAMDRDGRIVFANGLAEELFGYAREELLGRPATMLWAVRVRKRYQRNLELYFATQHPLRFTAEAWGLRRDGTEFIGEMSWGIVETERGPLLLAIGRDVSERRARDDRLRALAAMGERALAGAEPAELAAEAVELLRRRLPVDGARVRLDDGRTLAEAGPVGHGAMRLPIGTGDELLVTPAQELSDEEMGIVRAVANTLTVALARLRDEAQMRHDAVHDPLTHLANRILLRDRLEQAQARTARDGGETGVLFVDLDGFKAINDTHGHGAGDAVLVEFGARLMAAVRPADTVARVGGDEFVVVCDQIDDAAVRSLATRLQDAIRPPVSVGERELEVTASVGIALGRDPYALLADADAAAYRAKSAGGGRFEIVRRD